MNRPRPWPTQSSDVSLAHIGEAVLVGFVFLAAWFACAGLVGVFVGFAWRVAKMVQP